MTLFEPLMNFTLTVMAVGAVWMLSDVLIDLIVVWKRWGDAAVFSLALAMVTIAMHELLPEAEGIMIVAAIAVCTWKIKQFSEKGIV